MDDFRNNCTVWHLSLCQIFIGGKCHKLVLHVFGYPHTVFEVDIYFQLVTMDYYNWSPLKSLCKHTTLCDYHCPRLLLTTLHPGSILKAIHSLTSRKQQKQKRCNGLNQVYRNWLNRYQRHCYRSSISKQLILSLSVLPFVHESCCSLENSKLASPSNKLQLFATTFCLL